MPKITGLGYTRRDKIFAEFEIDGSIYTFKESHTSKNKLYKIGIYQDGKKIFKIDMDREQINRIKENKGIAGMEFLNEEGFKSWVEKTYLEREFNVDKFQEHFSGWFIDRFQFLQSDADPQVEYISYLMGMVPPSLLENFYRNNRVDLSRTFRYTKEFFTLEDMESTYALYEDMLDRIESELKQYLNQNGINYIDRTGFRNSMNREIVKAQYERFLEKRDKRVGRSQ